MIIIKNKNYVKGLTTSAIIAAMYVVLTYLSAMFGLSSGVIQLRISEALTILPVYTAAAVPGLFVGCIIANLLSGCVALDVVFGSIATLIGAVGTRLVGEKHKYLALLLPILSNTVIIPFVLRYAYGAEDALIFMFVTVGIGELLSCGVFGILLDKACSRLFSRLKLH